MRTTLLLLSLIVLSTTGAAQQQRIDVEPFTRFQQLTEQQGLSSNAIVEILQDNQGYIWIATEKGLNRYDGEEVIQYLAIPGDTTSLSDNFITDICLDKQDNLWIATQNGLNYYQRNQERFRRYFTDRSSGNSLRHNHVRGMFYADSLLWIETLEGTLTRLHIKQGRFTHFSHRPISQPYYNYHALRQFDSIIFIGGRNMGPLAFNLNRQTFFSYPTGSLNDGLKRDKDVTCFYPYDIDHILVAGIDGVYKLHKKETKMERILAGSAYDIMRDRRGDFWIATGRGVVRYSPNDNQWVRYLDNPGNPNSLIHENCRTVYEDRNGNIWVGTENGISINLKKKLSVKNYYHIPGQANSLSGNYVTTLTSDIAGDLWIGTESNGLNRLDLKTDSIVRYNTEAELSHRLRSDYISDLYTDSKGDLWIGLWQGVGFHKYNTLQNTLHHYALDSFSRKSDWYNDFYEDSDGVFWVGLYGAKGLMQFDRRQEIFTDKHYRPRNKPFKQAIDRLVLQGDTLKILVKRGTGYVYHTNSKHFEVAGWGINEFGGNKSFKDSVNKAIHINDTIHLGGVTYWATDKGLFRQNRRGKLRPVYNNKRFSEVHCLASFPDSTMLLGTDNGAFVYMPREEQWTVIPTDDPAIRDIFDMELQTPYIWLGTNNGLYRYNTNSGHMLALNRPESHELTSHLISVILEDSQKRLWVGTSNNGLNCMNAARNHIRHYPADEGRGLEGEEVTALFEDVNQQLVVGTNKGLYVYAEKRDSFFMIDSMLLDRYISAIIADDAKRNWVATHNGLFCFDKNWNPIASFYGSDGLPSNFLTKACYKLPDGQLVVGGKKGISLFYPDLVEMTPRNPRIAITSINSYNKILHSELSDRAFVELAHFENFFTVHFSAFAFADDKPVYYRYRLKGLSNNWILPKNSNQASYTAIPHGNYLFEVAASFDKVNWSDVRQLSIKVIPPFYKTRGFFLGIFLLTLGVAGFILYQRFQHLRTQRNNIRLEQKLLISQINPHFIFNSLAAIQGYILSNAPKQANKYLTSFSQLIRNILESSRANYISVADEERTISNYLKLQHLRFEGSFDYTITIDPSIAKEELFLLPLVAQPYIENAIEHGFVEIDYKGLLEIKFQLKGKRLLYIIEDNGIGIEKSKLIKRGLMKHESFGSQITQERINNFNRFAKQKIKLNIIDKSTANETGTCIIISFPLLHNK